MKEVQSRPASLETGLSMNAGQRTVQPRHRSHTVVEVSCQSHVDQCSCDLLGSLAPKRSRTLVVASSSLNTLADAQSSSIKNSSTD